MKYRIIERGQRGTKEEAVLAAVKLAGILALTAIAPNVIQCFYRQKRKPLKNDKYYLNNVAKRLIDRGFMKVDRYGQVSLTERGYEKFAELETKDIVRPKRWDEKYRVVVFDIEEKRKKERDLIRNQLISLGFIKLQHSVWISPYECEELITLMKTNRHLNDNIIYMTVESIENDLWLREKFGLVGLG
ncbi:MAG: CRISPR-associated endonuclease Cas2 [Patescibacteria group bacterium]